MAGSDSSDRARLSRRAFLGYGGATLAILGIPGCRPEPTGGDDTGELGEAIDVTGLAPTDWIDVWRAADLLLVRIGLYNVVRSDDGASINRVIRWKLGRPFPARPALLSIEFPPQHLNEQTFPAGTTPPPPPVQVDLASPSRVVLYIPDDVMTLPLTVDALLDAIAGYAMNVKANAAAPPDIAPPAGGGTTSGPLDPATAPEALETALELPWRLAMSPNQYGRWAHARTPFVSDRGRIELWHSRLGVVGADGRADERRADLRSARAIWRRTSSAPGDFGSLTEGQRAAVVTGTGDWSQGPPAPFQLERLHLSALGGTLHGRADFAPGFALDHWIHQAILGRDQYVEMTYRGYVFPYRHEMYLVQITERRLDHPDGDVAYLRRRWLAIPVEPTRSYDDGDPATRRQMPFRSITFTEKVIAIDDIDPSALGGPYIPQKDGGAARFAIDAVARDDDSHVHLRTPLVWYPRNLQHYEVVLLSLFRGLVPRLDAGGQRVCLAPPSGARPGDTTFEATSLTMGAYLPPGGGFTPVIESAELGVEAVRRLTGTAGATAFTYSPTYLAGGFESGNPRQLLLELAPQALGPVASFAAQADQIGGFVTPSFPVKGLSRAVGAVADLDPGAIVNDPSKLFSIGNPLQILDAKLFGCFALTDILGKGFDFQSIAPKLVSDALDEIERYKRAIDDIKAKAAQIRDAATQLTSIDYGQIAADVPAQIDAFARDLQTRIDDLVTAATAALQALFVDLPPHVDEPTFADQVHAAMAPWIDQLRALRTTLLSSKVLAFVYPYVPAQWGLEVTVRKVAATLDQVAAASADIESALRDFARGVQLVKNQTVTIDWKPPLAPFGPFVPKKADGLTLSATLRGKRQGDQKAGVDLLCALERFAIQIGPAADPYVGLEFDKLQFRRNAGKKPEIDVVFKGLHFGGPLAFLDTLRKIIPLDGFSDPPGVQITPSGINASYSLALPNVGVGMFSLENLAISAALDVPFVGDSMSFKFGFASREKPFHLSVLGLGGGGFFALELTPKGITALEAQLEFGAHVGINLGVASGGVTIMGGIYFGWHLSVVSLKGFVRIRGEVDVLGLISAAIELYMDLEYRRDLETGQDKVIGHAYLEIEVSVLFFSTRVRLECERKFAGSNGDPSFWQAMGPYQPTEDRFDPIALDGRYPWLDYCDAFAA
jgi:hypothetical protein